MSYNDWSRATACYFKIIKYNETDADTAIKDHEKSNVDKHFAFAYAR